MLYSEPHSQEPLHFPWTGPCFRYKGYFWVPPSRDCHKQGAHSAYAGLSTCPSHPGSSRITGWLSPRGQAMKALLGYPATTNNQWVGGWYFGIASKAITCNWHLISVSTHDPAASLQTQLFANGLRKTFDDNPSVWEYPKEAPGFGLALPWALQPHGKWATRWKISNSGFQRNKSLNKKTQCTKIIVSFWSYL